MKGARPPPSDRLMRCGEPTRPETRWGEVVVRPAWVTAISLVVLVAAIATLLGILIVEQPSQGADPAPDDGRSGVDDEGSERPPQVPADAEPAIIDHVIDGD